MNTPDREMLMFLQSSMWKKLYWEHTLEKSLTEIEIMALYFNWNPAHKANLFKSKLMKNNMDISRMLKFIMTHEILLWRETSILWSMLFNISSLYMIKKTTKYFEALIRIPADSIRKKEKNRKMHTGEKLYTYEI